MKKVLALLLSFGMSTSLLTGCSGSSDDSITVALWDNNQLAGLQTIADEWSEDSGVDVEFQVLDWGSYWTMLEAGVSGGELPDVFWMHSAYSQMYAEADVLLNMNDYIANDDQINLDDYYPGITELYNNEGVQFAMPKDHDTIAVVYNKAVFDKYDVDYPTSDWTWQEFADIAQEITDKGADDGVFGTYMNNGSNQSGWYNVVYSFGGSIISADRTKSGFDDPNTLKAMEFVADEILPACPSQDSMANTGGDTMLVSGKIGMYLDGSWMVNSYYNADNKDDLAWVEIPYADVNGNGQAEKTERVSIYNGLGWSIYKDSPNPDAAWGLVSAFTSKDGQQQQSELGVTMAAIEGYSHPWTQAFPGMDLSAFSDVAEDGTLVFRPYTKYTGRWENAMTDSLIDAWNNPSTMTEVCKQIAAEMNATIADE